MKQSLFIVLSIIACSFVNAEDSTNEVSRLPRGMKRFGGSVVIPDSQKGCIGIFNCQSKVSLENIRSGMDDFSKAYKYNVKFLEAEPVTPKTVGEVMRAQDVQVAVFIQECDDCPVAMLCAPESHWAIVNVKEITKGARNDIFAAARVRKELMRAFLCAAGAMNSQYDTSMMAAIKAPKDLDRIIEDPPVDAITRAMNSMKVIGVSPTEITTYKKACQAGWAPAPTNEYQQAIWDEIHSIPTQPIKIKHEKK